MSADPLTILNGARTVLLESDFPSPNHRLVYLSLAVYIELYRLPAFETDIMRMVGLSEKMTAYHLDNLVDLGLVVKRDAMSRDVYFLPSDIVKEG